MAAFSPGILEKLHQHNVQKLKSKSYGACEWSELDSRRRSFESSAALGVLLLKFTLQAMLQRKVCEVDRCQGRMSLDSSTSDVLLWFSELHFQGQNEEEHRMHCCQTTILEWVDKARLASSNMAIDSPDTRESSNAGA